MNKVIGSFRSELSKTDVKDSVGRPSVGKFNNLVITVLIKKMNILKVSTHPLKREPPDNPVLYHTENTPRSQLIGLQLVT